MFKREKIIKIFIRKKINKFIDIKILMLMRITRKHWN